MYLLLPQNFKDLWALYTLTNAAGEIFHLDIVKFQSITNIQDVTLPDGQIYLTVVDTDTDRLKVANRAQEYVLQQGHKTLQWRVVEIVKSWNHGNRRHGNPVMCIDTGETFTSAKAACDAHGLTYSQLVRHLKGEIGYKTVKGKRYAKSA